MIKYFVKNDNEILHHLCVYINDPIYNLEMSFIIEYKNKTNKINKIKFFKKMKHIYSYQYLMIILH